MRAEATEKDKTWPALQSRQEIIAGIAAAKVTKKKNFT